MTVGKIALGVFLGNLAFALVAWAVLSLVISNTHQRAMIDQTSADFTAVQNEIAKP